MNGSTSAMKRARSAIAAACVLVTLSACTTSEADDEQCGDGASCVTAPDSTFVSCQPVPRFHLGGIEYENQRFDDVVTVSDLGPVIAEIERVPPGIALCQKVELVDGEGSWPAGTQIHRITGVDPTTALAASLGNDRYLRFDARP